MSRRAKNEASPKGVAKAIRANARLTGFTDPHAAFSREPSVLLREQEPLFKDVLLLAKRLTVTVLRPALSEAFDLPPRQLDRMAKHLKDATAYLRGKALAMMSGRH
jgi:hypothetical protein